MTKLGKQIADLREDYQQAELDESDCLDQPLQQFEIWLQQAVDSHQPEPCAMTLATVGIDLKPSTRVVLLKGYDSNGLQFFTNYVSRKGQQIEQNNQVAGQFFWPALQRVVRVEGVVTKLSEQQSDQYFNSRPLDSRLGAWASQQSQVINSRLDIVQQVAKYAVKFALNPPRPKYWGGYLIIPNYWEFWQGRKSRLHDRIRYQKNQQGDWLKQRLSP